MKEQLIEVLTDRRNMAGDGTRPLGFKKFAERLGVEYTTLFRFFNGTKNLGIQAVRTLVSHAVNAGDDEMFRALVVYALGVDAPTITTPVDN